MSDSKNKERILYQFDNVCVGGSFDHLHIGHYVTNINLDIIVHFNNACKEVPINWVNI